MADGFFAGLTRQLSDDLRASQDRQRAEDEKIKNFQLDRLIEISQRPDLRDEEKAPLLSQIIELAGAKPGKGSKKKPGFGDMISNVLGIFDKPRVSQTGAQPIARASESDELASMMGIGQGGTARPREVSPYMTTPPIAGGEIPGMPQRQSPFYSATEMIQRRLSALEPELKLKQQYDRRNLEDANWEKAGEETVLPDGRRVQRYINRITRETRDAELPLGQTKTEFQERTRAAARVEARLKGSQANKKIEELAGQLAAEAYKNDPQRARSQAAIDEFWDDAASELLRKRRLDSNAVDSAMQLRDVQKQSLLANMPKQGEPTAAGQRVFTQFSKQISEIEGKIKTISAKGGATAAIGQKLRDGTVITAPGDAEGDVDRFIKQREQLLRELNEDLDNLKRQRSGEAINEPVPQRTDATTPTTTPKASSSVPKRGGGGPTVSNPQMVGDIFERPVGSGKWFIVDKVRDNGDLEVSPTKRPRR